MGAFKYTITIEADSPPSVLLGQFLFGGKVVALQQEDLQKLVSVTWLMQRFNFSRATILEKLNGYNKGSDGKHLYDAKTAISILSRQESKRGKKRIN